MCVSVNQFLDLETPFILGMGHHAHAHLTPAQIHTHILTSTRRGFTPDQVEHNNVARVLNFRSNIPTMGGCWPVNFVDPKFQLVCYFMMPVYGFIFDSSV